MGMEVNSPMTSEDRHDSKPRYNRRNDRDRAPRGDRRGNDRPRNGDRRNGDRKDSGGRGPRRDGKRDFHKDGDRKSGFRRDGPREHRPRGDEVPEKRKLPISTDPQKLLFKGTDLMVNGDNEKALLMFLHGSALMSKGCENNAVKILSSIGKEGFSDVRTRIADDCSDDALIEFDYLCQTVDSEYDCSFLESRYDRKDTNAIYRMICMGRVDAEDEIIDIFASDYGNPKVVDGLKILVKKKESKKAEEHLKRFDEKKERKQYVHTAFVRAMKGDAKSKRDLEKLSKEFPEAAFFLGYVKAREEGNGIPWLKEKFDQFSDLIISEEFNLRIGDTSYGMYLRAMKIKSKKEDWIPSMIKAAKNGSEEAMEELQALMYRPDIKKAVANIHLNNSDLGGLVDDYVNGLDETYYLDKYCESVPDRIVEVGRKIGERDIEREIDWLRAHAFMPECREALTVRAEDERYHCRKMIYALHDVGRNIEAADLYFAMEGHPDLPAVKWLAKVCRDDDAKEYVRSHFESIGQPETFDFIFVDDGYRKKPKFARKKR